MLGAPHCQAGANRGKPKLRVYSAHNRRSLELSYLQNFRYAVTKKTDNGMRRGARAVRRVEKIRFPSPLLPFSASVFNFRPASQTDFAEPESVHLVKSIF